MRLCEIDGCQNKHYGKGMCSMHYQRWAHHGDPTQCRPINRAKGAVWLREHQNYEGDDCLKWPFADNGKGYGITTWNGMALGAHRAMCWIVNGPPPFPDAAATHSCGQGANGCVNPKHLRWETVAGNQWDRVDHGTTNRGERNACHKLTSEEVTMIFARLEAGEGHAALAREFGVHPNTITDIANGRTWGWLTGRVHPDNPVKPPPLVSANDNGKMEVAA